MTLRVGWFSTARTPGGSSAKLLRAALDAIERGMDSRIEFVFSNRDPGEHESTDQFFEIVRAAGIPLVTLSNTKFRHRVGGRRSRDGEPLPEYRREYDAAVAALIAPFDFDLGVLAGYMLITTDVLCNRYPLLNLHPAAPGGPIGTWQNVIWQLIERKATESGVQWQLVTTDLDKGPVVTHCRYSLRGGQLDTLWAEQSRRPMAELREEGESTPLFQAIRALGVVREVPLLVETLGVFARGGLRLRAGDDVPFWVADRGDRPIQGYDLTQAVEHSLAPT